MVSVLALQCYTRMLDHAGQEVLEEARDTRRRIHSVAALAHASADVATPLLLSATLKVSIVMIITMSVLFTGLPADARYQGERGSPFFQDLVVSTKSEGVQSSTLMYETWCSSC